MDTSCEKYLEEKVLLQTKKSWDGVDVENFVSDLRDVEKEQKVLEKLKKAMKKAMEE